MGLSAAQARLLTITARKADCEFQSMSLSHQKIALSRNMEAISTDYQNALTKTKLVYDYEGTGVSNMALSYGLLMTPSMYNDYYPKFITDTSNKVILNSAYADAARAAGIPVEGLSGTPSEAVRNDFIYALTGNKVISNQKAQTIMEIPYNNQVGIGDIGGYEYDTSVESFSYDKFMNMLRANSVNTKAYGLYFGGLYALQKNEPDWELLTPRKRTADERDGDQERESGLRTGLYVYDSNDLSKAVTSYVDTSDTYQANGNSASISLNDLLEGEYQYNFVIDSCGNPITDVAYLQQLLVGENENSASMLNWMYDQFYNILGATSTNQAALDYAYSQIQDLLWPNNNIQDQVASMQKPYKFNDKNDADNALVQSVTAYGNSGAGFTSNSWNKQGVASQMSNCLGLVWGGASWNDSMGINLNNIAKAFLTSYVSYKEGLADSKYLVNLGKLSDSNINLYDPTKSDFKFEIATTSVTDEDDTSQADFYDTLFNMICMNGWSENKQIEDKTYMQEMLKSGMLYISTMSDDGCYYQENYAVDKFVQEVSDVEAIAQAEAKYNTEKAKIESKENSIDLKMRNLDTEISSLDKEYESTKSLIKDSIGQSFKRYEG